MKGSLHTDELMGAVVSRESGLRTARRISHCFVMDVPDHPEPLIITDAAVNIAPTLEDKVDIVQNAIDLAHALRLPEVRVAILSAMETVNPKVPSTIEAAALCKMADRGQITGALLDGPLALDNAIDLERGAHQEDRLAGGGARQRAGRARSRGRQHARQEPDVPGRCRRRRHRAGRARADHPHEPGGFRDDAAGLLRRGLAGRGRGPGQGRDTGGVTMTDTLSLVINAGSSSLKFQLFEAGAGVDTPLYRGLFEGLAGSKDGSPARAAIRDGAGKQVHEDAWTVSPGKGHEEALERLFTWGRKAIEGRRIVGAGHRVVHGGPHHARPVLVREVGSLAAALGGVDALVFTAGVGENDAATRAEVMAGLGHLGFSLDPAANAARGPRISAGSGPSAWVIPTNEELAIARHMAAVLAARTSHP